jgi:predicted CoA-substrate-specific enzyme activase
VTLWCGADVGATATKVVLVDEAGAVRAKVVMPSGIDYAATAEACLASALAQASASSADVAATVATGYGRYQVKFAGSVQTEIHCHGLGCFHLVQRPVTVVDIGGQDNKVIAVGADGRRVHFKMNRKCAAGTGAFLEEIALRLGLPPSELEPLARGAGEAVRLSSFCTVFAKTEILSHLARGVPVTEIVRGAFHSVVARIVEMDPLEGDVVMTGGVVAHNPTVAAILAGRIGRPVAIAPDPQFVGALGAALIAWQHARQSDGGMPDARRSL